LEKRGHNVLFFVPQGARLPSLAPHWPHWHILEGGKRHWRKQIEEAMRNNPGPYVFHAFHNAALKLAAWWGLLWRKRAVVVAHRGVLYRPHNPLPYWLPGIDLFLVNSRACAKVLRAIGLTAGRIAYVPNSIPDSRITPLFPPGHIRAELNIADNALVFLCIGNNSPNKGCEQLIRAFAAAFAAPASSPAGNIAKASQSPEHQLPLHLLLVGFTPELWLPLCAQLGIGERVHCSPPTEHIADYLAAGSVFVLPSLSESMPNTLLEAVRAGLPVIGSDVGAVPDIIDNCGLLTPPGDIPSLARALRQMALDPALRARLAAGAHERGQQYTPETRLDRIEHIYSELLQKKALPT
jgi:glycosyltransferase involved in cell wall biosynthesis